VKLRPEDWLAGLALVLAHPFMDWFTFFGIVCICIICLVYLFYEAMEWWIDLSRKEVSHGCRSTMPDLQQVHISKQ
jgi:hypothetical protein